MDKQIHEIEINKHTHVRNNREWRTFQCGIEHSENAAGEMALHLGGGGNVST